MVNLDQVALFAFGFCPNELLLSYAEIEGGVADEIITHY